MAKHGPRVVRHGTAKDLADHAVGYVASGSSEHTRHAAHGGKVEAKPEPEHIEGTARIEGRSHGRGSRTREQNIRESRKRIAGIARRMKTETDPVKLAALEKNYAIKSAYLAKLFSGSDAKIRVEPILTLPGEDDFEPWDK